MKYCANCGKQHSNEAKFCAACGTPFNDSTQTEPFPQRQQPRAEILPPQTQPPQVQPPPATVPPPVLPSQTPEAKKKQKTALIIGISAAALFFIVGIIAIISALLFSTRNIIDVPDYIYDPPLPVITATPTPPPAATPTEAPPAPSESSGHISRTFMVYMVGSDLESSLGVATLDIIQIIESGIDLDWNNVVIMTGGTLEWQNDVISPEKTEIYQIIDDDIIRVHEQPARNMADPETLTDFLDFCTENYDTREYSLILWNHGAGPNFGFGYDEIYDEILSIPGLVEALDYSVFGKERKLEFIGFDACLMGSIEIAYALSDYARYMIASQDVIPAWGWDYSFFGEMDSTMTTQELATLIIDMYFEFCEELYELRSDFWCDTTLSCMDLSAVHDFETELNVLYAKAGNMLNAESFPHYVANVRNKVKEFGYVNASFSYDLVDMTHLAYLMAADYPGETENLLAALDNLIVYSRANVPNAGGVSLYFPYNNKQLLSELAELYTDFNFADDYTGFMRKFIALLQDTPKIDWNISKASTSQISSTEFSLRLTPEQVETFASASYYIVKYYTDGNDNFDGYYFVFNNSDVTLEDDGRLVAHYTGKTQMLYDPEDDSAFGITMLQMELTDTYVRYAVPITLQDLRGSIGDWRITSAWIHIQTDLDGSNARVLSVLPNLDDDNPYIPSREIVDIYEYTHLQAYSFGRLISYNDDGSLKPFSEWESSGLYVGWEVKLDPVAKNNLTLVQQEHDDGQQYYMLINVKDVYGNVVSSDLIPIT